MQLPGIDRTHNLLPSGADAASPGANKTAASTTSGTTPTPSVINLVNPALKTSQGEGVYTSVSDPATAGSEAATSPKDWTVQRPAPEKVEDPPPKPIYEVLMDQIKSMWTASGSAIQLEQVSNQLDSHATIAPTQAPGTIAKESLVYDYNTIKKNEGI